MMQMNPMMRTFMQMVRTGGNPQAMVMTMLNNRAEGNPMLQNLLSLAQQGDQANIEQIARNMLRSQGFDFDKEFSEFMQLLNSK